MYVFDSFEDRVLILELLNGMYSEFQKRSVGKFDETVRVILNIDPCQ